MVLHTLIKISPRWVYSWSAENCSLGVHGHGKTRTSPGTARKGECFWREKKEIGRSIANRVHGFSWAESLPGKERLSSSSWAMLLSQGVGAPPSALLTWLNWVLYLLPLYTQLQKMSLRLFLLSWSHSTFLESILELTHKSIRAWWLFLSCTRIF